MLIAVLIIALSVAMVVGPVLWIRPSPRQKQQARIRARAAALGLQVRLYPKSSVTGDSKDREMVMHYQLPRPQVLDESELGEWVLRRRNFAHEMHFAESWDWQGKPAPARWHDALRGLLTQLPEDVFSIVGSPQGVAVVWNERGTDERVDQIAEALKTLFLA